MSAAVSRCLERNMLMGAGRRFLLSSWLHPWRYASYVALVMEIALSGVQFGIYDLLPTLSDIPDNIVALQKLFFAGTFFYFASLWFVKITINLLHIQLTRDMGRINNYARYFLYVLIAALPVIYVIYLLGCLPIPRRWAGPTEPQCPPIVQAFDFWIHIAIHLSTDIVLCVLPFPALLKISETRLRIAICGMYCLAIISIVVTIARLVLLATDSEHSTDKILILTLAETTTCIIIAALPGISSTFVRKYARGSSKSRSSRTKSNFKSKSSFKSRKQVGSKYPPQAGFIELAPATTSSPARFADDSEELGSLSGSTQEIIRPVEA